MLGFDTETTGLLRPSGTELYLQPFIIEIFMAKFNENFEVTETFKSFVKPPIPISDEIMRITGITNEMISDAPPFAGIYDELVDFVFGERVIFAHNCSFDINMLINECKRMGTEFKFPWPTQQICTVEASFPIFNRRMKLGELYTMATGRAQIKDAHRAEADTLGLIDCVKFLAENDFI